MLVDQGAIEAAPERWTLHPDKLEEALHLARNLGDRHSEAFTLKVLSNVALSQGNDVEALALAHAALDIAEQTKSQEEEASALCSLGNAELALGHCAAAGRAFELAEHVASKIDDPFRHDATAGRARTALVAGDLKRALGYVERLLSNYYGDQRMMGAARPGLIQFTCWQVLAQSGDPRAPEVLEKAYIELQERAAMVTDVALRLGFLDNIAEHRGIVAAWVANNAQRLRQK